MGFFDGYEKFYKTSNTSPFRHRLNSRYEAIVARNADKIRGRRVLDIASHDGRWSFAALQAGASHVTGIEPRAELIANAKDTFHHYGIAPSRYDLQQGDVFRRLEDQKFDVVFCLGFYYHTIRHAELLDLIERTGAELVVIDTEVTPAIDERPRVPSDDPRLVYKNPHDIQLLLDPVEDQQMAWSDSMTRNGHTLVGRPSRSAIEFMAVHFGYSYSEFDWTAFFEQHPEAKSSMVDYDERWRGTFFLSK